MSIVGPRCLHPMQRHDLPYRRRAYYDPDPVCWRPAGHAPTKHVSRESYEFARRRKAEQRAARRQLAAA